MEKDRALNLLQNGLLPQVHGAYYEALKMAIENWQPKLSEDCISRQAVLDEIETVCFTKAWSKFRANNGSNGTRDYIINYIKQLPPVQLEQKWIPVSERLPEAVGYYMTTVDYEKYGLVTGQRYYHGKILGWEDDCVTAWMPLPEPYKEESEE